MCLGSLPNINRKPKTESVRKTIGCGISIKTDENQNVYITNNSKSATFVQVSTESREWEYDSI